MTNITKAELTYNAVGAIPLGEAEFKDFDDLNRNLAVGHHRLYFCPDCGNVWARWTFSTARHWAAITRACPTHRYFADEHPGSLIYNRDDLYLLPRDALFREMLRSMREIFPDFPLYPRSR
jgi:hypothetical protein